MVYFNSIGNMIYTFSKLILFSFDHSIINGILNVISINNKYLKIRIAVIKHVGVIDGWQVLDHNDNLSLFIRALIHLCSFWPRSSNESRKRFIRLLLCGQEIIANDINFNIITILLIKITTNVFPIIDISTIKRERKPL